MIQLFVPGGGPLHRMPAGAKVVAVAVLVAAISLVPNVPAATATCLAAVVMLFPVARLPWRVLGREVWRLRWLVLILGAALWIFGSLPLAVSTTARVVALILLASLLTFTTRMSELLDALRRPLRPLQRWGVDAEAVALTVSLTVTMIPVVAGFAAEVREAARARGLRIGVRAVVPLLVRTLRHADAVGEALGARGLG